jgi:hypothetical protein
MTEVRAENIFPAPGPEEGTQRTRRRGGRRECGMGYSIITLCDLCASASFAHFPRRRDCGTVVFKRASTGLFLILLLMVALVVNVLSPEQQERLRKGSARWQQMSPEERSRARERLKTWQRLTPEQREQLRGRYERFKQLPPEEQQRIRRSREWFRSLPPDERARLRERWRELPPERRQELRERWRERPPERRAPAR